MGHLYLFRCFIFAGSLLTCTISVAQDTFEGTVTYRLEYRSTDSALAQIENALPTVSTYTVKGPQLMVSQPMPGGGRQAMITNADNGKNTLVMMFMGQEYRIDLDTKELSTLESNAQLELVETGKSKSILGRKCNFAWALHARDTIKVFYAPDLSTRIDLPPFKGLNSIPLEFETISKGMRIKYTATKVQPEPIPDDRFDVDPAIRTIRFEDFARSFAIPKD